MKKIILLILVFNGFTIQAQRYLSITNPTNSGGSRLIIPDNNNFDVTALQSKTITFKMRFPTPATNVTTFARIMQKISGTAQYGITIGSPVSGYRFTTGNSTTAYGSGNVTVPSLSDSNWHHVTVVLNDANDATNRSKFYIDGTLVYTTAATSAIDMSNNSAISFGATTSGGTVVTMDIDDIRFYNSSFTSSDIIIDRITTSVNNSTPNILGAYDFEGAATIGLAGIPEVTGITGVAADTYDGAGTGNEIAIVTGSSLPLNIWTGTTDTSWTNAPNWSQSSLPTSTSNVTIGTGTNQPSIATNLSINSLAIASGATLNVASGNLTVAEAIANSGTMTIENNANLIQGGTTNTNTGNITVKRNSSPLLRLDYTIWSSPVTNTAWYLKDFSPATLDTRFYSYNTAYNVGGVNGAYSAISSPSTTNFTAGAGYLIRMPDNADAVTPTGYSGVFTGKPNNGTISVALVDGAAAGLRYNLVGNPYPSPIKMQNFVFDNTANIESTLYFWRKTNGLGTAYCTWTAGVLVTDPGTFVTNGNAQSVDPADIIQTGQGFFVEAKSGATNLSFNNSQRVANNVGQFFRTKQEAEPSKIWLNATNATGDFSQMAITYFAEATLGVDAFDGKYINDSPVALTSKINDGEYTIQGRPAFDPSDVVSLNFKTDKTGDYTIAIDHAMGLFATGQDVYLVDSKTGTETDLKAGAYTFNAVAGVDNARFSLKYQKTLKVDANAFNENSVSVYKNNGTLYVNSGAVAINNIKVFDIQGRLITEQKNIKATTATINNLRAKNQVLIVKIAGENNNVVTKKVLN